MDLFNSSYTQESSVLSEGKMSFSYVVEEGPSEEDLECNESENMDSNMCETPCTYFGESVPGPSTTINSDTSFRSRLQSKAKVTEVIAYLWAPRGFGDLGRRAIYFQGAGEHW